MESLPEGKRPENSQVEASPAGNFEITDELVDLYLAGKKHAGSSPKEDFLACGDPLPEVGSYWILLDSQKKPRLILKTIDIEENKFADIPDRVIQAEGEGDLSVEYWKKVHSELYAPHIVEWGVKTVDEITVITEYFEIVFKGEV